MHNLKKDRKLIIRREEIRKEYWQKVENGEENKLEMKLIQMGI